MVHCWTHPVAEVSVVVTANFKTTGVRLPATIASAYATAAAFAATASIVASFMVAAAAFGSSDSYSDSGFGLVVLSWRC